MSTALELYLKKTADWLNTPSSVGLDSRISTTLHNISQANKIDIYKSLFKSKQIQRIQELSEYLNKIEKLLYSSSILPDEEATTENYTEKLLYYQKLIAQQLKDAWSYLEEVQIEDGTKQATSTISEVLDTSDKRKNVIAAVEKIFQIAQDDETEN